MNKTEKKKRSIVCLLALVLLVLALLLTGCSGLGQEGAGDKRDDRDISDDQRMQEEEIYGDYEEEDYKLKTIEMTGKEEEEALKKVFSYMGKCSELYKTAVEAEHGAETKPDEADLDEADPDEIIPDEINLDEEILHRMIAVGEAAGLSVACGNRDYNLTNYGKVDKELKQGCTGADAETEFYQVNSVGIFRYYRLHFKEKELYVTTVSAMFDEAAEPVVQQMEKIQAYRWEYTPKGWLIWEKALSRNQEMDMHIFCRILPLDEKCREITDRYIVPVSYLSNNLFLEDWDVSSMDRIEFNDLFDYLYLMETGGRIKKEDYPDGIPGGEFEAVVLRYFDITQEQLRSFAGYDAASGKYPWRPLGARNRVQQVQPSFPEVVKCVENGDGTISAYVEVVFIEEGTDCAFGHVVTLRESSDGLVYLGNKVDRENALLIPAYRPRREYEAGQ